MTITCCFIREQYFLDNAHFVKMLDAGNTAKQARRTHICIEIFANNNFFYIPLRRNLGADVRKFGRIGHSVPTSGRPDAGLDYRYSLIVNNSEYIEIPETQRIPDSQYQKLAADFPTIQAEFGQYIAGFIKAAKKNRIEREPLYRESSLVNFRHELCSQDVIITK